jgi:hypothetical protein
LLPGVHKGLGLDTQGIGDAVDVVEEANHLRRIVDATIVESVPTQHVEIGRAHLLGSFGELFGELTQGPIGTAKAGLTPVIANVMHKQISHSLVGNPEISDLSTEVMRMRASSVEAVIHRRRHRREHFTLATTEG